MKILWISGLPNAVQDEVFAGKNYGARAAWSWILGHLPPPADIELHIACPCTKTRRTISARFKEATFYLVPCIPGRLQQGFLLDPWRFKPLYNMLRPDVVHGWGTEDSHGIIAQALAPEHCVIQVQGLMNAYLAHMPSSIAHRYVAFREKQILSRAHTVFVESAFSASVARKYCGSSTNIVQIDHPLRPTFINAKPTTGEEKAILFAGALCHRKGYLDAISAFSQTESHDWVLRMVGNGSLADMQSLERAIGALPRNLHVERIPHASSKEIVALMQRSSILLLPSRIDTGPTILKEALAMGLWPICYDNSGPKEYISRFKFGDLAETGNVGDLKRLLDKAMTERPWQNGSGQADTIRTVRNELSALTIWKQLSSHYRRIAERGKDVKITR